MFDDLKEWWDGFFISEEDKAEADFQYEQNIWNDGFDAGSDWQASQD